MIRVGGVFRARLNISLGQLRARAPLTDIPAVWNVKHGRNGVRCARLSWMVLSCESAGGSGSSSGRLCLSAPVLPARLPAPCLPSPSCARAPRLVDQRRAPSPRAADSQRSPSRGDIFWAAVRRHARSRGPASRLHPHPERRWGPAVSGTSASGGQAGGGPWPVAARRATRGQGPSGCARGAGGGGGLGRPSGCGRREVGRHVMAVGRGRGEGDDGRWRRDEREEMAGQIVGRSTGVRGASDPDPLN